MKVVVSGRIQSDNYTNRDGQKVYSWQVIVEEQEFAESKKASEETPVETPKKDAFVAVPDGIDEDLPFI